MICLPALALFSDSEALHAAGSGALLPSLFVARKESSSHCCLSKLSFWPGAVDSPPLRAIACGISVLGLPQGRKKALCSFGHLELGLCWASLWWQLCSLQCFLDSDSGLWYSLAGLSGSPHWFCYFYRLCLSPESAHWKALLCWSNRALSQPVLNLVDVWDGLVQNLSCRCWHASKSTGSLRSRICHLPFQLPDFSAERSSTLETLHAGTSSCLCSLFDTRPEER